MPRFAGFVGPSYRSQSVIAAAERVMNWYPEIVESSGAKVRVVFYPTPGVRLLVSLADGPIRGLFAQGGRMWAVSGATVYEVFHDGTNTSRGTVARDTNPATFQTSGDDGDELFITSGDRGYILDLTTHVLTQVLASGARFGDFLDGRFLRLSADSTLGISDLVDGLTWNATQIARRSQGSDPWEALKVVNGDIYLLGERTSEVWYNAGLAPYPFDPIPGAFFLQGTAARFSVARLGNSLMWVGQSDQGARVVFRAEQYQPARVSTHAVEYALAQYRQVSDAVAFGYENQGHIFYVLNLPAANATWVYDLSNQLWHERGTWNSPLNRYDAWRPQYHCYEFDRHWVGDRESGSIYELTTDVFTDVDGAGIRRLRRAPHLNVDRRLISYPSFEVELETGVGLSTGQGSDPQVMLRWSDDGGRVWSNEHWVSPGKQGEYRARARWRRLGQGRDRVFEVVVSDPIPWRITDALVEAEVRES